MIEETLQFALQASGNAETALQGVTVALKDQESAWDRLSNKLPFVSAAISGALMAVAESTRRYVEATKDQSRVAGLSAETTYALDRALRSQGKTLSDIAPIMEKLSQARTEEARGQRSDLANRLRLGGVISSNKDIMQEEVTVLLALGRRLNDAGDDAQLLDRAIREFGLGSKEAAIAVMDFANGVDNGNISLGKFRQEHQQLSPMTEQLTKAEKQLGNVVREIGIIITTTVTPAMTDLLQIMTHVLRGVRDWFQGWSPLIQSMLKFGTFLKAIFVVVLDDLVSVMRNLGRVIIFIIFPFTKLYEGMFKILAVVGRMTIQMGRFFGKIKEWMGPLRMFAYPFEVMARAFDMLSDNIEKTKKKMGGAAQHFEDTIDGMKNYTRGDLFGDMINQILNMPDRAVPPLMELLQAQGDIAAKQARRAAGMAGGALAGLGGGPGAALALAVGQKQEVTLRFSGEFYEFIEVVNKSAGVNIEKAME